MARHLCTVEQSKHCHIDDNSLQLFHIMKIGHINNCYTFKTHYSIAKSSMVSDLHNGYEFSILFQHRHNEGF